MSRKLFTDQALVVAPKLLGAHLSVDSEEGTVTLRITEVEAYHGVGTDGPYDPGSHAKDRETARNASMFGPPGHAYVYFSYGMHFALNLVCSPEGVASGCLIRAGEVIAGQELAHQRRRVKRHNDQILHQDLARGPGNVAAALGINRDSHDGQDIFEAPFRFEATEGSQDFLTGPRVGVSGVAGGPLFPWRFWLPYEPTVSVFRPGRGAPREHKAL